MGKSLVSCFLDSRCSSYGPVSAYVTSRCSIETVKRMGLVLAWKLLSTRPTLYYKEIHVGLPSKRALHLALCSRLRTYRRDRHALSTARFCRTGQLATAHTCLRQSERVGQKNGPLQCKFRQQVDCQIIKTIITCERFCRHF